MGGGGIGVGRSGGRLPPGLLVNLSWAGTLTGEAAFTVGWGPLRRGLLPLRIGLLPLRTGLPALGPTRGRSQNMLRTILWNTGGQFNGKMPSYQYRNFHYKDYIKSLNPPHPFICLDHWTEGSGVSRSLHYMINSPWKNKILPVTYQLILTLMTPYSDTYVGQALGSGNDSLFVCQHHTITWTNAYWQSIRHPRTYFHGKLLKIETFCVKITNLFQLEGQYAQV